MERMQRLIWVGLILLVLVVQPVAAVEIKGRVVGITDGDTLTVLNEAQRQIRVRLAEIDTPESRQPYGSRARQALSDLAFGKSVRVLVQDTDRYGRTVGRVYAGCVDVNAEMIHQGATDLGLSAVQPWSDLAPPGTGSTSGPTWPLGVAGGGAHATLGMACCRKIRSGSGYCRAGAGSRHEPDR